MSEPESNGTNPPLEEVPADVETSGDVKTKEEASLEATAEPPVSGSPAETPPEPPTVPAGDEKSTLVMPPKCEAEEDALAPADDAKVPVEDPPPVVSQEGDSKPAPEKIAEEPAAPSNMGKESDNAPTSSGLTKSSDLAENAVPDESKKEDVPPVESQGENPKPSPDKISEEPTPVKEETANSEESTKATKPEEDAAPQDPYMGRLLELTRVLPTGQIVPLTGEVVTFQAQEGRFPPRYAAQWRSNAENDAVLVEDEWRAADLEEPPLGALQWALDHIQERFQQQVQLELESNPLVSQLLLYAAMEEALQTNLQIQQQQQQEGEAPKPFGSKQDPHPPPYYTTNPSSYLKAPTATDTTATVVESKVHMTPASLGQRVRQGCDWAHRYLVAQQPPPPPPPVPLMASTQRRSLRPKPPPPGLGGASVPRPTPVQQGGRVAMWLLEQLESIAENKDTKEEQNEKDMDEEKEEIEVPLKTEPKPKPKKASPKKDDAMSVDDLDESEEEASNKNDDDDDYGSKDAEIEGDDDDHELQDVEKERTGNLSPVPDEPMEEDEADEEAEDDAKEENETEEDVQHAVIYENPYLKPSFESLLEYLARPKSLTGENIQKAMHEVILRIKFNKRSSNVGLETDKLSTVDQVVLDQETPDYPPGKVVLKCVSDETFSELQKMEAQAFSRCKFALDVIGDEESTMQIQRKQELILQEIQFKEQKAWCKWRHKGIHEGYATWPNWQEAIGEWVKTNVKEVTTTEAAVAPSQVNVSHDDEALAKSLEESEETGGRRRTARRAAAAASDGVFYGNQSQLTQKQLMDALIRLVKTNRFQTLLRLNALVADDSSDPIRRSRVALGKLVWKRNLLARKSMDSNLSDSRLIHSIGRAPLLAIAPPVEEEAEGSNGEDKPTKLSAEENGLLKYIQELHKTELHLRRLVTKNLAEIPVAIIATAADERPGSMESMDAADFEDPSSIEWHTSGHDLLKKTIFRPASANGNSTDMTPCFWYEIQDYSKSIESDGDDKEEPESKERRMRFRAVPIPPPGESWAEQDEILILTEAQVHAGVKAAELEKAHLATTKSDGNPFSGASGDKVTLIPLDADEGDDNVAEIHGRILGYDNVVPDDDEEVEYRILILPESGSAKEAFWAVLDVRADTASYVCQPIGESNIWYSIEQFDYHPGSEAHQQCEFVLNWLTRQSKAGPFAEPVDPVALNIPTYPLIVKNPMDLSTMARKLESGQYSSILPGQTIGISPISRMLNGPFRKDIELMFDNAMLFNPPDDWIYQAAALLKKNTLKKISELSSTADQKVSGAGRFRQKRSVYVDDDSDVDMYEYESDNDDDYDGGRKSRKRKRSARGGAQKDEFAARAIEQPIRLQNTLRDATNLRGPFANLPINLSASSFSLSPQWSCRPKVGRITVEPTEDEGASKKRTQEMTELLELQRVVEANESAGLRRSTRAHEIPANNGRGSSKSSKGGSPIEYFLVNELSGSEKIEMKVLPSTRLEVEIQAEKLHEDYYSKIYQKYSNLIAAGDSNEKAYGVYSAGSFPPYMGRVIPVSGWDEVSWEIRTPFVVPALRWVLRGLIQSGHLTATEDLNTDFSSGVILTNDIYYWDSTLQPYETLDLRELQRKKRADKAGEEESEEEIELSEYEKMRAERVARNAERLRALGLA